MQIIGKGRTAEIFATEDGRALKLYFDWVKDEWVESEYATASMAFQAGLPTPQAFGLVKRDGRTGILFERVAGKSMLAILMAAPWRVGELARRLANLQADCLSYPAPSLPPVRAGLERVIKDVMQSRGSEFPGEDALRVLEQLPDGDRLCHMDFHPDNIMYSQRGWVILDWMNARAGDPAADVARTSMMLLAARPAAGGLKNRFFRLLVDAFYEEYIRTMTHRLELKPAYLDAWLGPICAARLREGIPGEDANLMGMMRRSMNLA